jgi:type VI protein secretion system component VasK
MHHHIRQKLSSSSHNARWLAWVGLVTVMMPSWAWYFIKRKRGDKWKNRTKTKTRLKEEKKENMQIYTS